MPKFSVTIQASILKTYDVEAENRDAAIDGAHQLFNSDPETINIDGPPETVDVRPFDDGLRLMDATTEQIQAYAASCGYYLNVSDCWEVRRTRAPWNDAETMCDAVDDFLRAYEA